MSITRFRPTIWSANLLVALRKALVYGGVANHDYEGEITQSGDAVRITSISRPTVAPYIAGSTVINPQPLVDAQRTLVIDQSEYWAFEVDDVDARQAKGNVMPQGMSEAAYALADTMDQYIASLGFTAAQSANVLGSTGSPIAINTESSPNDAYNKVLVPLRTALTKANVPTAGRYCIVTPDFYGALLQDSRFVKVNESGTEQGLRNGIVGRAAGFDILESNNVPNPTGGVFAIQAGVPDAITFAEQINKTEAYRPQTSFSDAVKGLALYGAKVTRPDALAIANVTVS
jgi:N4-gp56 family major capsid protein